MANEIRVDWASGSTLYAIVRDHSGQAWCGATQAFEDWGTEGHAAGDYAIGLGDKSGNHYVGDVDASVPAGRYFIQLFVQAGAAPADTDTIVGSQEIVWTGVGELTAIKLLMNKTVQDRIAETISYYDDDGQTVLFAHDTVEDAATFTRTPA